MSLCGEFARDVQYVKRDLLQSWYFKCALLSTLVWSAVYLLCASSMAHDALQVSDHDSIRFWMIRATTIQFPDFVIRTWRGSNDTFEDMTCTTGDGLGGSRSVPVLECQHLPMSQCRAVNASLLIGNPNDTHHWPEPSQRRIDCYPKVKVGAGKTRPDDLAWQVEEHGRALGENSYISMWFRPQAEAWISVNPVYIRVPGDAFIRPFFERDMHYHSSFEDEHQFHVATVLNSNFIRVYEPWDFYTAAMNVADLGGLLIFFIIVHKIIMFGVRNLGIENDSQYLAAGKAFNPAGGDGYAADDGSAAAAYGAT